MATELEKIREHAREVAARENCVLYDLELVGAGSGRTLRIFIDKSGAEGVSIDDCSRVSRGMDLILDVEDLIPGGGYHLEVSSPGLDRHLREKWHFEKVLGENIIVHLVEGLGEFATDVADAEMKRKKLSGLLRQVSDETIEIQDLVNPEKAYQVPLVKIQKAKLVFSEEKNFGKKKPNGKEG